MIRPGRFLSGWLLLLPLPGASAAAQGASGWYQAEAFYHSVSDGFGDWKGAALRGVLPVGRSNIWYGDLVAQEAFDDPGIYAAVGNRHFFNPWWFTVASVGGGTGDFFFPDLRADIAVGHSWLERKNLVTILGVTYVNSKDVYEDFAASGTVALYFPRVTAEAGGRINWSWPESVQSARGYAAVTVGLDRQRVLIVRAGGGTEGYQLTGETETRQRFSSYEASLTWRQWLSNQAGFLAAGDWYDSPFYTRIGVTLGIFHRW